MSKEGVILDAPSGCIWVVTVEGYTISEWPYFIESPRQIGSSSALGLQLVPIGASCFGAGNVKSEAK